MIVFTEAALAHIEKNVRKSGTQAFRLSVKKTGCSGLAYLPEAIQQINAEDILITTYHDVAVYLDKKCLDVIKGTEVDLVATEFGGSRLVYNNPNVKALCGCGESFHIDPPQHDESVSR